MQYVSDLRTMLANPNQYPYDEKDQARIKSIISSQIKRVREFEKIQNTDNQVKQFSKKRDVNLENVIDVLDSTLSSDVKNRIVRRMN